VPSPLPRAIHTAQHPSTPIRSKWWSLLRSPTANAIARGRVLSVVVKVPSPLNTITCVENRSGNWAPMTINVLPSSVKVANGWNRPEPEPRAKLTPLSISETKGYEVGVKVDDVWEDGVDARTLGIQIRARAMNAKHNVNGILIRFSRSNIMYDLLKPGGALITSDVLGGRDFATRVSGCQSKSRLLTGAKRIYFKK
jgi:hypothetical protein